MNRIRLILAVKYTVYLTALLILYVLQTTPGLFAIYGIRPMLVVPAAMAIAMYEGEFVGGFYGAFAGLLCDIASNMLFGFNGLFIASFCIVAGLMVIYLMHRNVWNAMLYVFIAMLVRGSLEFFLVYGMWGYDYVWRIYLHHTLPLIAYTTAVAPLMFWLVHIIHGKARKQLTRA